MGMPDRISQYSMIPQMAPGGSARGLKGLSEFGMKEWHKRVSGNLRRDARQARPMKTKGLQFVAKRHAGCSETRM